MSAITVTGYKAYLDHLLISSDLNSAAIQNDVDTPESTTIEDLWREFLAGAKSGKISATGFVDSPGSDSTLFSSFGTAGKILQVFPLGLTENTRCYFLEFLNGQYSKQADYGEVFKYSLNGSANGAVVAGVLNVWEPALTTNGTGYGDATQLGAVAAGQKMYAAITLALNSGSGTIDFTVESDDNSGFTSPTTRITFSTVSGTISTMSSVAGPITDTYWRVKYVVPSAANWTFAVTLGIS